MNAVWETIWNNSFNKTSNMKLKTDLTPFFWYHFFSKISLQFQIKEDCAVFSKEQQPKMPLFITFGQYLKKNLGK